MSNRKIIDSLHELIQINQEGEKGYKEASENINSEELKTILYRLSQQRALFRGELEEVLHKDYRDSADVQDSLASKVHRTWIDFKKSFGSNDDEAILTECERGEEHAIQKYTEVLDGRLPNYIEEIVNQQLGLIRGSLSQIREFKHEADQV
ncbi:ferritin-like domain-containing protein [Tunicatimonas pelagia]|uniref:ferritin-like domain-containing protein n=1 Tax=Tunicatimonas pelagia TaxID=931531 RepID=UPI002666D968|nr:PA2169 family four-helix-bundle protein [Tunicatimonas pelagia]WKN42843.1 PA2169 family four-helix-bundle protein [Tunicatimonas pelagia]